MGVEDGHFYAGGLVAGDFVFDDLIGADPSESDDCLAFGNAELFHFSGVIMIAPGYSGFGGREKYLAGDGLFDDLEEAAAVVAMHLWKLLKISSVHICQKCIIQILLKGVFQFLHCLFVIIVRFKPLQQGQYLRDLGLSGRRHFQYVNTFGRIHYGLEDDFGDFVDIDQADLAIDRDGGLILVGKLMAKGGNHGIIKRLALVAEHIWNHHIGQRCVISRRPIRQNSHAFLFGSAIGITALDLSR